MKNLLSIWIWTIVIIVRLIKYIVIIDNKAIRLDQAKSSNQEEDVANYDLVNVRRVYFSEDNQLEKNIKKNVQNKVRTQRYTILTWAPLSLIF